MNEEPQRATDKHEMMVGDYIIVSGEVYRLEWRSGDIGLAHVRKIYDRRRGDKKGHDND